MTETIEAADLAQAIQITIPGRCVPYARIKKGEKYYKGPNGDRARAYLSYRNHVQRHANKQNVPMLTGKRLSLDVLVYLKKIDDTIRGDGDNYFKSIADNLQKVAFANDKVITKGSFELIEDADERVEVEIRVLMT